MRPPTAGSSSWVAPLDLCRRLVGGGRQRLLEAHPDVVLRLRVVGGAGDLVQGPRVNWIGYCLNIHTFHKGINASKREWIP